MFGIIICSGTINDYSFYEKYYKNNSPSLVICVDGGAHHARRMGLKVDVLLGDFDSISSEDYNYFVEAGSRILKFPEAKDETDTELAVEYAINKGCKTILIFGGLGTRVDHSLANIFLLKMMLDRDVKGCIVDEYNEIFLIDKKCSLQKEENTKVSLIPITDRVEGIYTKGLLYKLEDATLGFGPSRGISNEFLEDNAEVYIKKGLLLVIKARD
jgi:thiamine pyrophosphokinase